MMNRRTFLKRLTGMSIGALLSSAASADTSMSPAPLLPNRWLFIFRDLSDPKQVDRTMALFPRAKADGYNAVVFSHRVAPSKAVEFQQAARRNGLALVAMVMDGAQDRNDNEGFLVKDALFIAGGAIATHETDNSTHVVNGDFEDVSGNHFNGWSFQDSEGVTTFADHDTTHGGSTSLRMENVAQNPGHHCRIMQNIALTPRRQYRISVWVKTENLSGGLTPEVKLLTADGTNGICWQTFHCDATQDWKHYDLTFNSLDNTGGLLYLGCWGGASGKFWWDDFRLEEIALVNVLRRSGCPMTVCAEDGTEYEELRDYRKIVDPMLNPWWAYHEPPVIHLTAGSRIAEGQRLRVSYYHPVLIYEDRVSNCLSEPHVFEDWETEVNTANNLYHPDAFFMQHDEIREINQCAGCQAMQMTPGELLAWNIRKAAGIIRKIRPDAPIWVWSDMFDPYHNAKEKEYYLVNGSLAGSWKGLDKDIGIVNWNGGGLAKDCQWFAGLGLRQILSGYYDGDSDGTGIAAWQRAAQGIPGIVGAMYTTWEDNYSTMDVWARKAWGTSAG